MGYNTVNKRFGGILMTLTWLGHSCFLVESQGYQIVLDPYAPDSVPGYQPVSAQADQVLCSHEHRDHHGIEQVTLRQGGVSPFTIETISTWHDDQQGALRGPDTIHILDDGSCRIAHLGDLGCELTDQQKQPLKNLDALMIPVGGFYTIDAAQAKALVDELKPRVVIPMHYRGEGFGYDVIGPLAPFTDLCSNVVTYSTSQLELTPQTAAQVAVLAPQNR